MIHPHHGPVSGGEKHPSTSGDVGVRVAALYEHWLKAGPPPLGVSMARRWDARLIELRDALHSTVQQVAPEAEADHLATLTDCPNSRADGLHCGHYQEGDGPCCNCKRPNWCPDGGVA